MRDKRLLTLSLSASFASKTIVAKQVGNHFDSFYNRDKKSLPGGVNY